MNAFAKFGIEHLSPSSLNTWREHPARWAIERLLKIRSTSPAAIRGKAVEVGMEALLRGASMNDAQNLAIINYAKNIEQLIIDSQGEIPDGIDKERDRILPMLKQVSEWKKL